ncbi:MAG: ABC transporter permease [Candidatus Rokuibacteriota bacterium]|nr:MAG: ABC transporter permease [Candidatus Rokubacteria bacterium]
MLFPARRRGSRLSTAKRSSRDARSGRGEEAAVSSTEQVLAAGPGALNRPWRPSWHRHLSGPEFAWAIAFIVPYAAVLVAFAIFPIAYGFWMASSPSLYVQLFASDEYWDAVVTTALYVGIGVNTGMFLALLLSGFFMRRRWWVKAMLVVSMLPWALPAQTGFISFHWMMVYWGFLNSVLEKLFGIYGPDWLSHYWLALGANIVASTWKTMPFWTLILLAGRTAIPQDLYDAADIDGATGFRRFVHLVVPLLANLYLVCTLLSAIWMIGDFNTPDLVSSGAPVGSTEVLATLGVAYLFDHGNPGLGVAVVMTALPVLIPLGILLIRRLHTREVQL